MVRTAKILRQIGNKLHLNFAIALHRGSSNPETDSTGHRDARHLSTEISILLVYKVRDIWLDITEYKAQRTSMVPLSTRLPLNTRRDRNAECLPPKNPLTPQPFWLLSATIWGRVSCLYQEHLQASIHVVAERWATSSGSVALGPEQWRRALW